MVTPEAQILVSEEAITSALEAIRRGNLTKTDNQILFLHSVNLALRVIFAADESYRPTVLAQILTSHILSIINSILLQHVDTQLHDESETDVLISVFNQIPMTSSELLLGTLWIYIHYFRFDCDIDRDDFCSRFAISKRTLQRYQSSAIRRLTHSVIQGEVAARKQIKRSGLPDHISTVDIDIYSEFAQDIVDIFEHPNIYKKRIIIFGPPFSGKTFLASRVAHYLIDENIYDDIVWIDTPESVSEITDRLDARIHELGDRLFVVVDNADKLFLSYHADLCKFIDGYSFVSILVSTSKKPQEIYQQNFRLFPINSSVLMKQYRRNCIEPSTWFPSSYPEQLANIPMKCGILYQTSEISRQSLFDLVISLDIDCSVVLVVISLMRDGNCREADLRDIVPPHIIDHLISIIQLLENLGLISIEEEASGYAVYHTSSQIRMLIIQKIQDKLPLMLRSLELVVTCLLGASKASHLSMIESLLLNNVLSSDSLRDKLIEVGFPLGMSYRHWLEWSIILEHVIDFNTEWRLAFIICCIRMGKVSKARRLIQIFIADMGRRGAFEGDFEYLKYLLNETELFLAGDTDMETQSLRTLLHYHTTKIANVYSYFDCVRTHSLRSYDQKCLITMEYNMSRGQ
jgi:hypothetical protein